MFGSMAVLTYCDDALIIQYLDYLFESIEKQILTGQCTTELLVSMTGAESGHDLLSKFR